jgi:hypothetical protein
MSARKVSAAVCTALALMLASASPALAYGNDSATYSQYDDPTCTIRGTNGDDGTPTAPLMGTPGNARARSAVPAALARRWNGCGRR